MGETMANSIELAPSAGGLDESAITPIIESEDAATLAGVRRSAIFGISTALLLSIVTIWLSLAISSRPASAVPSFARQTGQPCAACHTAFPELTPFGRRFKLSGYTLQGGDTKLPPVSGMIMPTFTHTQASQDPGSQTPGTKTNNNLVTQQITGFYAGQVYGNLGAFIQVTGNPVTGQIALDASDARYVDTFKVFGKDALWGVTVNNTPTVQDVWNTTPAFSFPQIASSLAPAFSPPLTHIEGGWGQKVAGAGGYIFWNDMLYAELTGYGGLTRSAQETLGEIPGPTPDGLKGVAPYWRLALEPHWGDHYLMIGTFGMYGQVIPSGVFGFGTDNFTDIGFDSQYQYDGNQYSVTLKLTDIIEQQKLNSTFAQGGSSNLKNRLNSFKASTTFVWDHTYEATAGYFNVSGSRDIGLYSGSSVNNSPNGEGLIFDLAYLPFSHGSPWPYSTYNARIGISYTKYLKAFGGTSNFDGAGPGGTHDAKGNNTTLLYVWLAF